MSTASAISWGVLGPDGVFSNRRVRPLGLAPAVRLYNELAVPGIGGISFLKPLVTACLAIKVASRASKRASNIEVANAIEAYGCLRAFRANDWTRDFRLRGSTKLHSKREVTDYKSVKKSTFYVTQPVRQQTVQPLMRLGLIHSTAERFNLFELSSAGEALLESFAEDHGISVERIVEACCAWVDGKSDKPHKMGELLAPDVTLGAGALRVLRGALVSSAYAGATRRQQALDWVASLTDLQTSATLQRRPPQIVDDAHWNDIRAGAHMFSARDAAIEVLNSVESTIALTASRQILLASCLGDTLLQGIEQIKEHCDAFCKVPRQGVSEGHRIATTFCADLLSAEPLDCLRMLLVRDGRVLVLAGDHVRSGIAFRGDIEGGEQSVASEEELGSEAEPERTRQWPNGVSRRIINLFYINLDLAGGLDRWLREEQQEPGTQ